MRWPSFELLRAAHARGRLLPGLVVLAVVAVLIEGASRTARETSPAPPASPPPASPGVPPPRSGLDKAPLSYAADYFLQLGQRTRARVLAVGAARVPAIVLKPGLAAASPDAAEQVTRLAWLRRFREERRRLAGSDAGAASADPTPEAPPGEPASEASLLTLHRELGLALLELPVAGAGYEAFRKANPATLLPGASVAAVSLAPDGRLRVVPGHLVSRPGPSEPPELSLSLPAGIGAAAVVDLDGAVFALVVESGGATRVLSVERVLEQVEAVRAAPGCQALAVSARPPGAPGGLRVDRVVDGAFAGEPRPRARDVLLEWQGRPVSTADELRRRNQALPAWALTDFLLLRAGRRMSGRVTLPGRDCAPGPEPPLLLTRLGLLALASDDSGLEVLEVARPSPAGEAGVRTGDRIVEAGRLRGRLARRRLESYEAAPGRLTLVVLRDAEVLSLLVPAPPEE
jgi:hypothetical protein